MAAGIQNYMQEGLQAAEQTRKAYMQMIGDDDYDKAWNDSWREFYLNYALMQQANQNELDAWNRQNAYNSPSEQMKRLQAAGLNPNLMYQLGNSGNASSAPGVHTFRATNNDQAQKMQKIALVNQTVSTMNQAAQQFLQTLNGIEAYKQNRIETGMQQARAGALSWQFSIPQFNRYRKNFRGQPFMEQYDPATGDTKFTTYFDANPWIAGFADPQGYGKYLQNLYQTDQRAFLKDKNRWFNYWQGIDQTNWVKYGMSEREWQYKVAQYNFDFLNQLDPTERNLLMILGQVVPMFSQAVRWF